MKKEQTPQIISIGSGKGGVGKSVLCTNIAAALALSGLKVVLVDTDFGASNQHGLLGISNPKYGFQDYFRKDDIQAEELLLDTGIDNLKFLSGAGDLPGSTNMGKEQIDRVSQLIQNLDADIVLLDLAPGSGFNTLDFFNLGHKNIVVTTPEMTSVMNCFSFIKSALFRRLSHAFKNLPGVPNLLDYAQHPGTLEDAFEIDRLRLKILDIDKEALVQLNSTLHAFSPKLIVNRVRKKKDILMGDNLVQLTKKYLEMDAEYLGYIIESDRVRDSVDEMIPFLIKDPQSKPSESLQKIIGAMTEMDFHLVKKDGAIFVSKQIRLSSGWER